MNNTITFSTNKISILNDTIINIEAQLKDICELVKKIISLSEENIDIDSIQQKIMHDINGGYNEFEILYLRPIHKEIKILLEEVEKVIFQSFDAYEISVREVSYSRENKIKFPVAFISPTNEIVNPFECLDQFDDQEFILVINDNEKSVNNTFQEQTEQTNIIEELLKKKRLLLKLRNEKLFLEQENERIRNEKLLLEQENKRVRNENLLPKQENKQTRNNNIPKSIDRTNFTYTYSAKQRIKNIIKKGRRILADSETERLLNKLKSIDPLLANTWCNFF
ncbi:1885_t:CDS:2 [Gigaspora margarita]|uniref:1885_t:CDS:1 n=1 Tax=Gigaspora margarita TaxID=4874 RepID=A0ABN7UCE1_GIGMA|nr:1885_t:CDS:2 [Gigaspora margarita]